MKVYLIRHGQTKGNSEGRYVGRTDEPLLPQARERLYETAHSVKKAVRPAALYVSPMLRCRETARILFPGKEQTAVEAFRECDFGVFEYKNYRELNGDQDYQRFIDSGGTWGFPGGEAVEEFRNRSARGFYKVIDYEWGRRQDSDIVFVVHGGTVMAVMDRFSDPHKDYFEWQTGNGGGYAAEVFYDRESGKLLLSNIRTLILQGKYGAACAAEQEEK